MIIAMFHTTAGNNATKYNGWDFDTTQIWDSEEQGFWYDPTTTMLFKTEKFKLSKNRPLPIQLYLKPYKVVDVGFFSNIEERTVEWEQPYGLNNNSLIGLEDALLGNDNATTCTINLNFNFNEFVFEKRYFSFWDFMMRMGGLGASLLPFISALTQILILYYLYKLSHILMKEGKLAKRKRQQELVNKIVDIIDDHAWVLSPKLLVILNIVNQTVISLNTYQKVAKLIIEAIPEFRKHI